MTIRNATELERVVKDFLNTCLLLLLQVREFNLVKNCTMLASGELLSLCCNCRNYECQAKHDY